MVVATLIGSRIGRPLPLWMGVLGHEGGTLLVVFNSLLLLAARGSAAESLIREPPEVGVRNERLTNAEPKTAVAV
jgi:hypothetical protein